MGLMYAVRENVLQRKKYVAQATHALKTKILYR